MCQLPEAGTDHHHHHLFVLLPLNLYFPSFLFFVFSSGASCKLMPPAALGDLTLSLQSVTHSAETSCDTQNMAQHLIDQHKELLRFTLTSLLQTHTNTQHTQTNTSANTLSSSPLRDISLRKEAKVKDLAEMEKAQAQAVLTYPLSLGEDFSEPTKRYVHTTKSQGAKKQQQQ